MTASGRPRIREPRPLGVAHAERFPGRPVLTILRRRDAFRKAFHSFDPAKVARFTRADIARLLKDPTIIRSKAKISATIAGARSYMANRHDLAAVKGMVWDSPSALFVATAPVGWRGYWGSDDVMQHLHDMYQQPFRIDPVYEEEKVVLITPDVADTYAPVKITVAYGGQNPAPRPFIMVLLWIRTPKGWKMTTDIRIPVPPEPAPATARRKAPN